MNSGFANVYLALEKLITSTVKEIKFVDQDLGQLDGYEKEPPVQWPCVLIDFTAANYSNLSQMVQWVEFNISFRLGFAPFSSASSISPDVSKQVALGYYELEDKLYKALAGFTAGGTIQPLIRQSAATERREDLYRVRELIFTTAAEDEGAKKPVNMTPAMLDLAQQIISDQ